MILTLTDMKKKGKKFFRSQGNVRKRKNLNFLAMEIQQGNTPNFFFFKFNFFNLVKHFFRSF